VSTDRFEEWDAAYVLGALSAPERAEFELHLPGCADCRTRVAELEGVPALFSGVPESAFAVADPPPPEGLLLSLQREVRGARVRRRWYYATAGAAAAAALVVATALIARGHDSTPAPKPVAAGRAMTNVSAAPLQVDAAVTSVTWGTRIDLRCMYDPSVTPGVEYQYGLVVVDKSGVAHDSGSWRATPGRVTTFSGGSSLKTADIASIEVTLLDGTPLLTLQP